MRNKLQWFLVIVLSMTVGAGAIVGLDSLRDDGATTPAAVELANGNPSPTAGVDSATVSSQTLVGDVSELYAQVRPSVVQISGSSSQTGSGGLGSGVVLDTEGNILTNNHVIEGFDTIDVLFWNDTVASARVIGTDPGNDLAIIRVDDVSADNLRPVTLGNSDRIDVGESVIAVGNPFERTGSVTSGIVSGIGRTLSDGIGRPLRQLIQSDAAINPGNSGGGLFNSAGELIGITTAIENPTGDRVFAGIGYAVPINTATRFLPDMLAGTLIQHPRLGVSLGDLTPAEAGSLGLPVDRGVIILGVESGSAADKAGLQGSRTGQGADVIVEIDGTAIENFDDLANYIDSKDVGDTIVITVIRDGQEVQVEAVLDPWQSGSA